jgi:hypothetical protein
MKFSPNPSGEELSLPPEMRFNQNSSQFFSNMGEEDTKRGYRPTTGQGLQT